MARPAHHEFVPIQSMEERFEDGSLDSLDMLMVAMYMSELYGIDDEVAKELKPETVQEMFDLITLHKTKEPESIEAAMKEIK